MLKFFLSFIFICLCIFKGGIVIYITEWLISLIMYNPTESFILFIKKFLSLTSIQSSVRQNNSMQTMSFQYVILCPKKTSIILKLRLKYGLQWKAKEFIKNNVLDRFCLCFVIIFRLYWIFWNSELTEKFHLITLLFFFLLLW